MVGEHHQMKATLPASIAAKLNATMLGRCVLSHAGGFNETDHSPDQWPDRLRDCMIQVFENLAAEITVLRQEQPNLTAEAFAQLLLAEANHLIDEDDFDQEIEEDDDNEEPDEWLTHPSLTAEQRNSSYR
jgi:hypothetical protein